MTKFVASVIAGIVATVLGGLILNQLTSPQDQQRAPHVTAPVSEPPDIDFTAPAPPKDAKWFSTYADAERACGKGKVWQLDNPTNAWRYFCL
jgi:hypothetical protein